MNIDSDLIDEAIGIHLECFSGGVVCDFKSLESVSSIAITFRLSFNASWFTTDLHMKDKAQICYIE